MLERICAGEWPMNQALPNEHELCALFGVSIGTLRKATDELVANGMLVRQQGRGTFIAQHSKDRYLFSFFHITSPDGSKEFPSAQLLDYSREKVTKKVADMLRIPHDAEVHAIKNLLFLQKKPTIFDLIYLPVALFPDLTRETVANRTSTFYSLYQKQFNLSIVRTDESIEAVSATDTQAKWLRVHLGSPLLQITRIAQSFAYRIIEARFSYVNTHNGQYKARHFG